MVRTLRCRVDGVPSFLIKRTSHLTLTLMLAGYVYTITLTKTQCSNAILTLTLTSSNIAFKVCKSIHPPGTRHRMVLD